MSGRNKSAEIEHNKDEASVCAPRRHFRDYVVRYSEQFIMQANEI